jgi:hypothetical protein
MGGRRHAAAQVVRMARRPTGRTVVDMLTPKVTPLSSAPTAHPAARPAPAVLTAAGAHR